MLNPTSNKLWRWDMWLMQLGMATLIMFKNRLNLTNLKSLSSNKYISYTPQRLYVFHRSVYIWMYTILYKISINVKKYRMVLWNHNTSETFLGIVCVPPYWSSLFSLAVFTLCYFATYCNATCDRCMKLRGDREKFHFKVLLLCVVIENLRKWWYLQYC